MSLSWGAAGAWYWPLLPVVEPGASRPASADHDGFLVDAPWLAERLHDPQLRLFDTTQGEVELPLPEGGVRRVSAREAYDTGHLPGARYLDLAENFSDPASPYPYMMRDLPSFSKAMRAHGVGRDSQVVLYSAGSPSWATRVWWMLRHAGFHRAAVLDGGLHQWRRQTRILSAEKIRPYPAGDFTEQAAAPAFADKAAVLAALGEAASCVVDALPEAHYQGRSGGRHGRPGHITGSLNLPVSSLLDTHTQTFLPREALRAQLRQKGLLKDGLSIITYCGGGIAATLDAFVLTWLGQPGVRVYDASLAEWARDGQLPMSVQV